MARQDIAVQPATLAGTAPSYTAAHVDGFQFIPQGGEIIIVKNGGGSPSVVTIQTPVKVSGLTITAPTVSVPATTGERHISVREKQYFLQADGKMYFDLSFLTSVTVAVIRPNL